MNDFTLAHVSLEEAKRLLLNSHDAQSLMTQAVSSLDAAYVKVVDLMNTLDIAYDRGEIDELEHSSFKNNVYTSVLLPLRRMVLR